MLQESEIVLDKWPIIKNVNFTETVMYCGVPRAVSTIHKVTGLREKETGENNRKVNKQNRSTSKQWF